jgi:hypothetical protein
MWRAGRRGASRVALRLLVSDHFEKEREVARSDNLNDIRNLVLDAFTF